ncbi:hypothetical protein FP2506_17134 [Fulvimarina pelagi HTCC2506]|uniref:Uncharacterized protein n=1 Tax=Fulvimarina pelagi HTCC2506 TaxID=314231 RepID=Q0G2K3_9HYPH|nr:hypothetical protein [Fulvimarina pelagi]EAU42178.1 hypothetical protein FP2506_17134 [Fulvimarina pelagi HTCC2506]
MTKPKAGLRPYRSFNEDCGASESCHTRNRGYSRANGPAADDLETDIAHELSGQNFVDRMMKFAKLYRLDESAFSGHSSPVGYIIIVSEPFVVAERFKMSYGRSR